MGVSICEHTTCTRTHVSSKMINPFIQKKINASYYYREILYLITYIQIVKMRFLRSIHRNNHFIKFHIIFIRRDTNLFIIFTSLAYLTLIFCQIKKTWKNGDFWFFPYTKRWYVLFRFASPFSFLFEDVNVACLLYEHTIIIVLLEN